MSALARFFICFFEDDLLLSLMVGQLVRWKFKQIEVENFK
jgi:hypothetical protein